MDVTSEFSRPALAVLGSAVLTAIAAFLPWMTTEAAAGRADVEASTMGIEGIGLLTLFLAILVGIVLILDFESRETLSIGVLGVLLSVMSLWKISDISGAVSPGLGLYLTILGGIGLLIGGLWGYQDSPSEPSEVAS